MEKWFAHINFLGKKGKPGRRCGTNARKVHCDMNAQKMHCDINASKMHRAVGILLAAVIFQTMPFDGTAVSASGGGRTGCVNTTQSIRRTAVTGRRNRGMIVPMRTRRNVTGQWREKTAAPQRS